MVRRSFYFALGLLLILFLMTACEPGETELVQAGEVLYVANCGRCHAQDGGGYDPLYPNLDNNPIVTLHDPIPVIDTVLHGRGSMMGFRDALNDNEVAAIITYIRQAWSNDAAPVPVRQIQGGNEPNGELPVPGR